MLTVRNIIVVLFGIVPSLLVAQERGLDAIHLKNGTIYRGTIVEEVPNVSYKIESKDGNRYAVNVSDVEKITREPAYERPWGHAHYGNWWSRRGDSIAYEPRQRGYFNELQVLVENVQGGVRFVNGYKFGRFGYLGIGFGFDRVFSNPFNARINGLEKKELAATYLPLYVYHAGDGPMKGRVTPFYALEAGYALAYRGFGDRNSNVDDFGNRIQGGVIAGAGLGFKLHNRRRRGHFSILFNVNYKQVRFEREQLFINNGGQVTATLLQKEVAHLIIPGIRLGIGF